MVRNDKFFFGYGEAAEYEQEEKDKAQSPDNGDNIIIKSEEFEVEVPDGYEITRTGLGGLIVGDYLSIRITAPKVLFE